jgi:hypothetical protein
LEHGTPGAATTWHPCSSGLSTTNQQYFSLTTNQPPVSNTFFLEQINTSNQQPTKRTGRISYSEQLCCRSNFRLHFHRFVNLAWLSMHEILWAAQTA